MAWLPSAVTMLHRAVRIRVRPGLVFSVGAVNPRGRFTRYLARKEAERVERQFPADFTAREHRVSAVSSTCGMSLCEGVVLPVDGCAGR